jgi:hypothetical protein
MLLLQGQTGEAWKPSKKKCSYGNREELDKKVIFILSLNG